MTRPIVMPAPVFVAPVGGLKAGDAAQVGIQSLPEDWTPAFAGVTTFSELVDS